MPKLKNWWDSMRLLASSSAPSAIRNVQPMPLRSTTSRSSILTEQIMSVASVHLSSRLIPIWMFIFTKSTDRNTKFKRPLVRINSDKLCKKLFLICIKYKCLNPVFRSLACSRFPDSMLFKYYSVNKMHINIFRRFSVCSCDNLSLVTSISRL